MGFGNFKNLPSWLHDNVFYRAKLRTNSDDPSDDKQEHIKVHPYDANLISSETESGRHMLLLDLDSPHWYTGSSSDGHGHLYIDARLELEELQEIIALLAKYGIVQRGIERQAKERKFLSLRMPGMRKDVPEDNMSLKDFYDFNTAMKV